MKNIKHYFYRFDRRVWLLTAATFVEATGRCMVVPFISLFLKKEGVSLEIIGFILAAAPFASVIFGLLGGQLSDKIGRKPVQIIGVTLSGCALIGFGLFHRIVIIVAILNFLNGMTRTFYRPATSAALTDITDDETRAEAFGLNRMAINAGFGIGPLIGVAMFGTGAPVGFLIAGSVNLLVGLYIALIIPETRTVTSSGSWSAGAAKVNGPKAVSAWKEIAANGTFWLWLFGISLIGGVYGLIQTYLPLVLEAKKVPVAVYSSLLFTNALLCVLLQLPANYRYRKAPIGSVFFFSKFTYVIGFAVFGIAASPVILVCGMVVLTVGEVIGAGVSSRFIPEIAPRAHLGRYLGLSTLQDLASAGISIAAGFVMGHFGGPFLFTCAGIVSLVGAAICLAADRMRLRKIGTGCV